MGSDPSDGGSALVAVSIVLSIVQFIFVALRFLTRYTQGTRYGADDYVILIALAGNTAKAIVYIVLVEVAGLGYDLGETTHPAQSMGLIRKGILILEILDFPLTVTPAKLSLLLFYVRVFPTRKFTITAYTVGFFVLGLGITVFFQTIFQCSPVAYGWDSTIEHGKCIDQILFYRVISPINVVTGICILVMPMPLVWRIQAPTGQKVALTIVFMLGGLGFLASILRMIIYYHLDGKAELNNVNWFPVKLGILTVVEGSILIITGCLVAAWPLVKRYWPRRLSPALSFGLRTRQHHCWYMTRVQAESDEELTQGDQIRTPADRWDAHSGGDLEGQRWWVTIEGGAGLGSSERVVVEHRDKSL